MPDFSPDQLDQLGQQRMSCRRDDEIRGVLPGVPIIGFRHWTELEAEGWRWEVNVPPFISERNGHVLPKTLEQQANSAMLEDLKRRHGPRNVATGNAWDGTGPAGLPETVGVYVKDPPA